MLRRMMMASGSGGGGGAGHLYWRIYFTSNNGDATYSAIQEIEMRTVAGGANLCTGGVAGESSFYSINDGEYAFNGNKTQATHAWVTAGGKAYPAWVSYKFTSAQDIKEIKVWPQVNTVARAPKDMVIQHSDDGVSWTDAASFPNQTGWVSGSEKTFAL